MKTPQTKITPEGKRYHIVSGVNVRCYGNDCTICKSSKEHIFEEWEESIPYPLPPKGKRYKIPLKQKHRGKAISEICYSCKKIPCYICKRTECPEWMKEEARKGQEEGCVGWERGRCADFICDKGVINSHWER